MLSFNDLKLVEGTAVTFMLNEHKRHAHYGKVEIEDGETFIRFNGNEFGRKVPIAEIYAAYPFDNTLDLSKKIFKDYLDEKVQSYIDNEYSSDSPDAKTREINIEYVYFTEYQRHLFQECYHDKSVFEHVNWFSPSACYYPVGWYNLGGVRSDESDAIGEIVEASWQSWISGIRQNFFLNNITSNKMTYYVKE